MADDLIRLRRKADNFFFDPMTEKEAKSLDGYPGDFEVIKPPKPIEVKDDDAAAKPRAPRKPRSTPTPTPAPAPTPADGDEAEATE